MSKTKERGLVYPASAASSLISRREYLRTTLLAASAAGLTRRTLAQTATGTSSGTPKKLSYFNPLRTDQDLHGFQLEGSALVQATAQGMRLKNSLSPTLGQESNFVLWCPEVFPDQIEIRWNFSPLAEPGLCVMFFAAQGLLQGQFVPLSTNALPSVRASMTSTPNRMYPLCRLPISGDATHRSALSMNACCVVHLASSC